jgi:selenocysteine-specific elongation factor
MGMSSFSSTRLDKTLDKLRTKRTIIQLDSTERRLVHRDFLDLVQRKISDKLGRFHNDNPLKEGISKQELRSMTPGSDRLFKIALDDLISSGTLVDQVNTIRSAKHSIKLKDDERNIKEKLFGAINKDLHAPPVLKELISSVGAELKQVKSLLSVLEKEGKIIKIKEEMYFSSDFIKNVRGTLVAHLKKQGSITPSGFQEITGSSRKYNIPLLEYFDREKVTLRVGDQRVLRGAGSSLENPKDA